VTVRSFVAIDGDRIGHRIEGLILRSELLALAEFSQAVHTFLDEANDVIRSLGGEVYLCGGDNILAELDSDMVSELLRRFTWPIQPRPFTFSVGIGPTASLALLALRYAKSVGPGGTSVAEPSQTGCSFHLIRPQG
jgi:hypothetical protein